MSHKSKPAKGGHRRLAFREVRIAGGIIVDLSDSVDLFGLALAFGALALAAFLAFPMADS